MTSAWAGERLRAARAIVGITGADLAAQSGFSQALISSIENGRRDLTDEVRLAVAAAIDFPEEFFLVAPSDVPLDSLRFRKYATASATATSRAKALFQEIFRVSSQLAEDVGYHHPNLPLATGNELAAGDIDDLAAQTREALQLDPEAPIPHVLRAMERAGISIAPIVLPGDDDDAMTAKPNRHFGLSYWGGPGDRGAVGFFPGSSGDRDRFTFAHELGHMVLHSKRRAADSEREANLFAGELLMPTDRAREALGHDLTLRDYAHLKATWGISISALVMRAKHVGAIDEDRASALFRQMSARGWRKQEPVKVASEQPALLAKLVDRQYPNVPVAQLTRRLALPAMLIRSMIPQIGAARRTDGNVLRFPG